MAEASAVAVQTVAPGEAIIFTVNDFMCQNQNGNILHRQNSGAFLINGGPRPRGCCCCCGSNRSTDFLIDFGANIAIPTGGTVGEISVAIAVDGVTIPYTNMRVTPAAVENYWHVSNATSIPIWKGCCQTVSVINTSTQDILVQEANIVFPRNNNGGVC